MKVLKFGGSSLANHTGLNTVIQIIKEQATLSPITVVASARGNATNELEHLLDLAKNGKDFQQGLAVFKREQLAPLLTLDVFHEFELLKNTLTAVKTLGDYSTVTRDLVLAQGEILAVKILTALLKKKGVAAVAVHATDLFTTENMDGTSLILEQESQLKTTEYLGHIPIQCVPIITGFIASNSVGQTTTLGRNGSNYTASLIAQFTQANEVLSYTNVDGIFTANPTEVPDAKSILNLTYQEANELANFGASILHEKTIAPLAKARIPLRILNTFNPAFKGTVVSHSHSNDGVKSISVQQNVSLISIEGAGLLGKVGIDARIFNALENQNVSIGVVSQGSSERGVSFIVNQEDESKSIRTLKRAFKSELEQKIMDNISTNSDIGIITIVGQSIQEFHRSLRSLAQNNIAVLLINNTTNGQNISVVVKHSDINKATNLIHAQIFGVSKKINVAVFGIGTVGSSFIHQVVQAQKNIEDRKGIHLNIFALANSKKVWFPKNELTTQWEDKFTDAQASKTTIQSVLDFAQTHHLENLIAIDNTASSEFVHQYIPLIENGFDLISSNKLANTGSLDYYQNLRQVLKKQHKTYLYETNVGAGLPLIDTIKLLHDSGENITRIKGIFSGSLSFLFNQFSERDDTFSTILQEAIDQGFTEPDPREDLCGNDVARKLLILARELDLENELTDIEIQNLVPSSLASLNQTDFLNQLQGFDTEYAQIKANQKPDHVLRYVGDLYGDLQQNKGQLKVDLVSVPKSSALGQVSGSDSIIEIFTESYGDHPIVIQGAGAGAQVTARGVFGDLLRISDKK